MAKPMFSKRNSQAFKSGICRGRNQTRIQERIVELNLSDQCSYVFFFKAVDALKYKND